MDIIWTLLKPVIGPVVKAAVSLQSFIFARPRLDIDLLGYAAQRNLGVSIEQDPDAIDSEGSIPVPFYKYDMEFIWNYKLIIKNNSSKTAYGIQIEKIPKASRDYLENISSLATLREGEQIELDYIIRYYASANGREAEEIRQPFPYHLDKIEIIVSYTNEARFRFYTNFATSSMDQKINEHLIRKPGSLSEAAL